MILTYFFCLLSFLLGWIICALLAKSARDDQLDHLRKQIDNFQLIQTQKKVPEDISIREH